MASFSTNEFKAGLKVMLDGNPYAILENEFVKPGKGQAFNRVKMRNLRSGRVLEQTFMVNFGTLCTLKVLSNYKPTKPRLVMH